MLTLEAVSTNLVYCFVVSNTSQSIWSFVGAVSKDTQILFAIPAENQVFTSWVTAIYPISTNVSRTQHNGGRATNLNVDASGEKGSQAPTEMMINEVASYRQPGEVIEEAMKLWSRAVIECCLIRCEC